MSNGKCKARQAEWQVILLWPFVCPFSPLTLWPPHLCIWRSLCQPKVFPEPNGYIDKIVENGWFAHRFHWPAFTVLKGKHICNSQMFIGVAFLLVVATPQDLFSTNSAFSVLPTFLCSLMPQYLPDVPVVFLFLPNSQSLSTLCSMHKTQQTCFSVVWNADSGALCETTEKHT